MAVMAHHLKVGLLAAISAAALPGAVLAQAQDDSVAVAKEDTMRMVVVQGRSRPPVMDAIDKSLNRHPVPKVTSLGDILGKYLPGLQDRILHPFAIKERRRERRHKRLKRILREYEQTKTPNELLMEAIQRERTADSISAARSEE